LTDRIGILTVDYSHKQQEHWPSISLCAHQTVRAGDEAELPRCKDLIIELCSGLVLAGPNWIAGLKSSVAS
jgi:hypothetical protein